MKTLTVSEATHDLAALLKQVIAGAEIGIRSDEDVVVLRPLPKSPVEPLSPREALKQLQQSAHLSPTQAETYLREVQMERLAAEKLPA